jgi:hypothetical protein
MGFARIFEDSSAMTRECNAFCRLRFIVDTRPFASMPATNSFQPDPPWGRLARADHSAGAIDRSDRISKGRRAENAFRPGMVEILSDLARPGTREDVEDGQPAVAVGERAVELVQTRSPSPDWDRGEGEVRAIDDSIPSWA